MPKRGPRCQLGYHGVFTLIVWVLYTGRPGQCVPVPQDAQGHAAIHDTTVDPVFARGSDDGALEHALTARVRQLADQHQLDLSLLQGDGTNTVAQQGGDGSGSAGDKPQKGEKGSASIDNHGDVWAPLPVAPVHEADPVW